MRSFELSDDLWFYGIIYRVLDNILHFLGFQRRQRSVYCSNWITQLDINQIMVWDGSQGPAWDYVVSQQKCSSIVTLLSLASRVYMLVAPSQWLESRSRDETDETCMASVSCSIIDVPWSVIDESCESNIGCIPASGWCRRAITKAILGAYWGADKSSAYLLWCPLFFCYLNNTQIVYSNNQ
jgi:hypothetical protein